MIDKEPKAVIDFPLEQEVIAYIKDQKTRWENATVWVTDKVAFDMRDLIRQLRRNYWGVFKEPMDKATGRKKIWVPMTESVCESVVKEIDLDTKDINFRAKNRNGIGLTPIVRNGVRNNLDNIYFGEILDEMERNLAIDGTVVWKTVEDKDAQGKPIFKIIPVDLLNFYIDPSARSIQTSDVGEVALLSPEEFASYKGWKDKQDVKAYEFSNAQTGADLLSQGMPTTKKLIQVYEWWGIMPLAWITGKKKDKETMIPGHVVLSNIDQQGGTKIHVLEKNTKKEGLKPYEECRYRKVQGRWYGKGPAESVMMLQTWMNVVVNIRITRNFVAQLGIFKIRKGAGVTSQSLKRMASNGALMVKNMDDIEQFVIQEATNSSYSDEQNIQGWGQRVTSAFEIVTGEQLPASTSATSASLQSQGAQSSFTFVKKGVGYFLQRWLKRHAIPILQKRFTADEIIRIVDDMDELKEMDTRIINEMLFRRLTEMNKKGQLFTKEAVLAEKERLTQKFEAMGAERYAQITDADQIDLTDYDVQVYITNEEIDKAVLVNNLNNALATVANVPGLDIDPADIVRQVFDVLGLQPPRKRQPMPVMPAEAVAPAQAGGAPNMTSPTAQQMVTSANTGKARIA